MKYVSFKRLLFRFLIICLPLWSYSLTITFLAFTNFFNKYELFYLPSGLALTIILYPYLFINKRRSAFLYTDLYFMLVCSIALGIMEGH